jgi:hypothetical protein
VRRIGKLRLFGSFTVGPQGAGSVILDFSG